jgi:hypothetical protein
MSQIGVNGTQCGPESAFAKNLYRHIDELCGLKESNRWHYGANKGFSRIAIGPADWQAGWICPNSRLLEVGTVLEEWKVKDAETEASNVLRRGVLDKLEEEGLTIEESAPWYASALREKAGVEISTRSQASLSPDAAGEQQGDIGQQTGTTKAAAIAKFVCNGLMHTAYDLVGGDLNFANVFEKMRTGNSSIVGLYDILVGRNSHAVHVHLLTIDGQRSSSTVQVLEELREGKKAICGKHLNDEVEFGDTITRNGQTVPFLVSLSLCDKARKEDVRAQMVKLLCERGILCHDDERWMD